MTEEEAAVYRKHTDTDHSGLSPVLVVEQQSFTLRECQDREGCDWMRWMLAKALIRFREETKETSE